MNNIKVPGTGCAICKTTMKRIGDGKVVHAGGVPGRDKIAGWVSHHG
jgi:hypothetical protein